MGSFAVIELVLATANQDKVREITDILGPSVRLIPRPAAVGDVEETGDTLVENARLKAQALLDATGLAAVADDTGLEVDALGGAPGVRSSRYAGEGVSYQDNVDKLLDAMSSTEGLRTARFRTVALIAWPGGQETIAEGVVEGFIATEARGSNGFGYDPLFVPIEGDGRTFAEMDSQEKHLVSHRGRAFRLLSEKLPK